MMILAVDSSAVTASAALVQDGRILGEYFCNAGLTHSQTLMPMIRGLLKCMNVPMKEVELLAVSAGPGSFTGIRIGIAGVKGLAFPENTPCLGVSTLEAAAFNLLHLDGTVCAVMDARCGQVYNALFNVYGGVLSRLTPDRAICADELAAECQNYRKPFYLIGDGANLCYNNQRFLDAGASCAPELLLYQRASGVAFAAEKSLAAGISPVSPAELMPVYLRPPQAERALNNKTGGLRK